MARGMLYTNSCAARRRVGGPGLPSGKKAVFDMGEVLQIIAKDCGLEALGIFE